MNKSAKHENLFALCGSQNECELEIFEKLFFVHPSDDVQCTLIFLAKLIEAEMRTQNVNAIKNKIQDINQVSQQIIIEFSSQQP